MDDVTVKLFKSYDFILKIFKEGHECAEFGQAIAHWCHENFDFSQIVGLIYLNGINTSSNEKVKYYLEGIKPFLMINDKFTKTRLEWLLGNTTLSFNKIFAPINELLDVGYTTLDSIQEECNTYLSPLAHNNSDDTILVLLWRYKGRMDVYTVQCLSALLSLMAESDAAA